MEPNGRRRIMMTVQSDMSDHDLATCNQHHHDVFPHDVAAASPGESPGESRVGELPGELPGESGDRAERFRTLRREAARLEGRSGTARLPLGVGPLDSALAGGLVLGRVHLLSGRPGHDGALSGFTVALLRRLLARQEDSRADRSAPVVWCPAAATGGAGMLYAAGLAALGLDPGRLLIVDSPSPGQRLAALEDILRTSGLAAVVMEYDGAVQSGEYWMRLARRAQLAAEASGVTGFLTGWPVTASGFETRWRIAPSVASAVTGPSSDWSSRWNPCWQVDLLQARGGRAHATRLCWRARDNSFRDLGPSSVQTGGSVASLPLGTSSLPLAAPFAASPGGLPHRRGAGHRSAALPAARLPG